MPALSRCRDRSRVEQQGRRAGPSRGKPYAGRCPYSATTQKPIAGGQRRPIVLLNNGRSVMPVVRPCGDFRGIAATRAKEREPTEKQNFPRRGPVVENALISGAENAAGSPSADRWRRRRGNQPLSAWDLESACFGAQHRGRRACRRAGLRACCAIRDKKAVPLVLPGVDGHGGDGHVECPH